MLCPLIFDKFSPINDIQEKRHSELFGIDGIEPFNSVRISRLFSDKQKTHDILSKFSIPTVTLKNDSENSIRKAVDALAVLVDKHPDSKDFSKRIVVKDRFGAGGNNIFCTEKDNRKSLIKKILSNNKEISFVLQPFAKFKSGYIDNNHSGFVDIRLIYLGQKLIQSYIRTSAEGDFRCNAHQGGDVKYIEESEIPIGIKNMAVEILKVIKSRKSLLALDFIVSNNGNIYLMEGNSHPGVTWDSLIEGDMENTKRLILAIIDELDERSNTNKEVIFAESSVFSDTAKN